MPAVVVLTAVADRKAARQLSDRIVRKKLAACVSVIGPAYSTYRWKGRIERSREVLLLIKTLSGSYAGLERELKRSHPYELPEILRLDVRRGSKDYLAWLERCSK